MKFDEIVARARGEQRRRSGTGIPRILIATGECGRAGGALRVLGAIRAELNARGVKADAVEVGCNGMCHQAVLVDVERPDMPRVTYGGITAENVPDLIDKCFVSGKVAANFAVGIWADKPLDGLPTMASIPFWRRQRRVITSDLGVVDPHEISDYIDRGGYGALSKALVSMTPEQVIEEIKASRVTGRGGAYFPAGLKLEGCRQARGFPKYLAVNAEEGEPGAFKDRHIMEGNPHLLVEGAVIAAYAIGAEKGYLYINGEAEPSIERMERALRQAGELNLVGRNILDSGFSFYPEIRLGAGGYILGEASTLHNSIQGERPIPRVKLQRSVESGVFDKPTVTNNVETLSTFPGIINNGGSWYASLGNQRSTGTKLVCLSGNVARPGMLEVPMGTTLREIVEEMGGGATGERELKAILVGGPSGGVVPASLLDTPVEEGSLEQHGSILGSGSMVVVDDTRCVVDLARLLTAYNQQESCGECTPCREGTVRMLDMMNRIVIGEGSQKDVEDLQYLCGILGPGSLCGLGQAAPNPLISSLRHFKQEYDEHILNRRCPAGICEMGA